MEKQKTKKASTSSDRRVICYALLSLNTYRTESDGTMLSIAAPQVTEIQSVSKSNVVDLASYLISNIVNQKPYSALVIIPYNGRPEDPVSLIGAGDGSPSKLEAISVGITLSSIPQRYLESEKGETET